MMLKDNDFLLDRSGRVLGYVRDDKLITPEGEEPVDIPACAFLLRYHADGGTVIDEPTETGCIFPETEIGSTGLTVVLLQTALKCRGYYAGAIDGDFGQRTHAALHDFRSDNGFTGDTIATQEVYEALFAED